jgi:hypothetical protein
MVTLQTTATTMAMTTATETMRVHLHQQRQVVTCRPRRVHAPHLAPTT